jgi:hypothetical protein
VICFALFWLRLNFYLFHYFMVVYVDLAAFVSKACVSQFVRCGTVCVLKHVHYVEITGFSTRGICPTFCQHIRLPKLPKLLCNLQGLQIINHEEAYGLLYEISHLISQFRCRGKRKSKW